MEHSDSSIDLRSKLSNDDIIDAAVNLQMGQTMYQNDTFVVGSQITPYKNCLLYTSPSPRDSSPSRMPSSA